MIMKRSALALLIVFGLVALGIATQVYLAPTQAQNAPRDPSPP
jgi:hypothetical protein